MKRIAEKLIDFGMDFQYENFGSEGEKITSFTANIEVTLQNGKVYFEYDGEQTVLDESERSIAKIVHLVNEACIQETT